MYNIPRLEDLLQFSRQREYSCMRRGSLSGPGSFVGTTSDQSWKLSFISLSALRLRIRSSFLLFFSAFFGRGCPHIRAISNVFPIFLTIRGDTALCINFLPDSIVYCAKNFSLFWLNRHVAFVILGYSSPSMFNPFVHPDRTNGFDTVCLLRLGDSVCNPRAKIDAISHLDMDPGQ